MPMKSIYVSEADVPYWDEAESMARTGPKGSMSKLVCSLVRRYAEAYRPGRDLGLPVGFDVPASMKDPRVVRAEAVADDVRERVLDALLAEIRMED